MFILSVLWTVACPEQKNESFNEATSVYDMWGGKKKKVTQYTFNCKCATSNTNQEYVIHKVHEV